MGPDIDKAFRTLPHVKSRAGRRYLVRLLSRTRVVVPRRLFPAVDPIFFAADFLVRQDSYNATSKGSIH